MNDKAELYRKTNVITTTGDFGESDKKWYYRLIEVYDEALYLDI